MGAHKPACARLVAGMAAQAAPPQLRAARIRGQRHGALVQQARPAAQPAGAHPRRLHGARLPGLAAVKRLQQRLAAAQQEACGAAGQESGMLATLQASASRRACHGRLTESDRAPGQASSHAAAWCRLCAAAALLHPKPCPASTGAAPSGCCCCWRGQCCRVATSSSAARGGPAPTVVGVGASEGHGQQEHVLLNRQVNHLPLGRQQAVGLRRQRGLRRGRRAQRQARAQQRAATQRGRRRGGRRLLLLRRAPHRRRGGGAAAGAAGAAGQGPRLHDRGCSRGVGQGKGRRVSGSRPRTEAPAAALAAHQRRRGCCTGGPPQNAH